ncbi:MAG: DNA ligase [Shewanella sp.]|nr:DNA ligase [Shewanella sp.]MCF1431539.1 DNA ligase [Shewanella sp.]MCF1458915.1 DNA ligase [Shewanella sp.]
MRYLLQSLLACLMFCQALTALAAPEIQLAVDYQSGQNLSSYWVSEKLDGVRGRWTGKIMVTRSGRQVPVPDWFTQNWPAIPMDGELWLGRGRFDQISGLVRRQSSSDSDWRDVRFMVFDLPDSELSFDERSQQLRDLIDQSQPHLKQIEQFRVNDEKALMSLLDEWVAQGAEGLMLHHQQARYVNGRQPLLMKLKPEFDAEAIVIAHIPGKGKYTGMLGALRVRMANGMEFSIGTGFSDEERRQPPPIGSQITFKYNGLTGNGLPRFASFYHIKASQ